MLSKMRVCAGDWSWSPVPSARIASMRIVNMKNSDRKKLVFGLTSSSCSGGACCVDRVLGTKSGVLSSACDVPSG